VISTLIHIMVHLLMSKNMSNAINIERRQFLRAAALTVAGATGLGVVTSLYGQSGKAPAESRLPTQGQMPSLGGVTEWLNTKPLAAGDLRGKVVLINFWTYSCINWRRQLPYVRAWAERYGSQGLLVIGVHSPEFAFEKNVGNVRWAAKEMRVDYPVAIDSNFATWRAFKNQYWPALYFVDARGRIRHHQFGEGEYDKSEVVIQRLLADVGTGGGKQGPVSVVGDGAEAPADWNELKSPENYVGYERTEGFASRGGPIPDQRRPYTIPAALKLNQWALAGDWTIEKRRIVLNRASGRIAYRFHARDLHLVMGPSSPGTSVRFRMLIDGDVPGTAHGIDVDDQGNGRVTESRMYQLIRQPKPILDRRFDIEFIDSGVEAFSFTFG
jgi:thiol-disulfide isomerase/thioredoxin